MPFFYQSGEQIELRDLVSFHGESGEINLIAGAEDDPNDWYVQEFGGGVMVESKMLGLVFIKAPVSGDEDLEFISRNS